MKEEMLLKILDEIDAMTAEEYRDLFDESQKLPDSLPSFFLDWQPVPANAAPDTDAVPRDIMFSVEYKNSVGEPGNNYYSGSGGDIWIQAA
jgi:hypothetical protein